MLNFIVFLFLGYVLGSVSPGYFWGQVVKGIDIRKFGNRNTGASNTYRVVGPVYGVITAGFDLLKSPLVYYLSLSKVSPDLAILVGLAAVLGHIFPFYLGFRGGRGVASLNGLFIFSLFFSGPLFSLLLLIGVLVYFLGFVKPVHISFRHWLKLFSVIFPLGLLWLPSKTVMFVLGGLLLLSFIFDGLRWLSPGLNKKYLKKQSIAKNKEQRRFSGYTIFLFSSLLVVALFSKEIAMLSLIGFVLGDIFAPFSVNAADLPQRSLVGEKTWAGFIIVLAISFFAGWFLRALTPLDFPLRMIIFGALATATFDQLAFWIDDNLLVPLGSAMVLGLLVL